MALSFNDAEPDAGISDRYRDEIAPRFLHGPEVCADGPEIAQQLRFDVARKTGHDVPNSTMHEIK